MALIKVVGAGDKRAEALRLADAFRARVVDATTGQLRVRDDRGTEKLDAFVELMRPLGLAEVSRTGVAAIAPRIYPRRAAPLDANSPGPFPTEPLAGLRR